MAEINLQEECQKAKSAGMVNRENYKTKSWSDEYQYHIENVDNPLSFDDFKHKFILLDEILTSDPDGKNMSFDTPIQHLCNQLGY